MTYEGPLRLLISAGGTGGGVYPALAVADALGRRAEVLWVGAAGGIEERLVSRTGIPFQAIPAAGLHGVGLRALPANLLQLAQGTLAAREIIGQFDPDALFFTGGYVGGPVALAALGRPKVTFVPDIEPALSQRLIGRLATRICVTNESSRRFYRRQDKVRVTGYPTRFGDRRPTSEDARRALGLRPEVPVVLVLGGSLGARSINLATWQALPKLLPSCQLLHIVGSRDWDLLERETAGLQPDLRDRYLPVVYLEEEMAQALAAADLAVSRAGASALGEYPLFGLPAVLVPYPHGWRYQQTNAEYLAERGAALVLADEGLEAELSAKVLSLLGDRPRLQRMGAAAAKLATAGAEREIARIILAAAGKEAEA